LKGRSVLIITHGIAFYDRPVLLASPWTYRIGKLKTALKVTTKIVVKLNLH